MESIRSLKNGVKELLEQVGYRVTRTEQSRPVDLREEGGDPRHFTYYGGSRSVVVEVPVERGVGLGWFSLDEDGAHPFVRAVRRARETDSSKMVVRKVLNRYYERVQPASAAEWLGFSAGEVPELADEPAWARVWPWDGLDISARRNRAKAVAAAESNQWGRKLTISDGWNSYGPVSQALLEMETERLVSLMESIRCRGYLRNDRPGGDINISVLWESEQNWRFLVTGGAHRMAVLAGLGYRKVPVRVTKLIRRTEVDIWPNVTSGLFDQTRALELFDRTIEGRQPELVKDWTRT